MPTRAPSPPPDAPTDELDGTPDATPSRTAPADSQREVIRFLSRPDSPVYRTNLPDELSTDEAFDPTTIDTHSARLFVGERVVCKIKRAVAYGYLDMRDPDTRRRLCEQELEINHRTLPDVYLDVVAVTRERGGALAIDGAGEPLEWVLRMRRFAQSDVLDDVARAHRLTQALARRLGEAIARFHASLPSVATHDGHARALEVVDELDAEFGALADRLPREDTARFAAAARAALESGQALLDKRAADGFVRRCHGDLHLRNVLLRDGWPVPFDALEFDERMATTDVLYDLAFLVMDLGHRDLPVQQNLVLNEYLLHSAPGNAEGLALLPAFLAMRAAVRAMTTAQAANAAVADARPALDDEANGYLGAALDYLAPRRAMLLAVGGLSGSGKSRLAETLPTRIARAPGALLLGSDATRKAALGVPALERLDPSRYTTSASEENYRLLLDKAGQALRAGFAIVVDATWLDAHERRRALALARACDVPFVGLWLDAPADTLRRRVELRRDDVSDATLAVLETQLALGPGTPHGWCRVDAGGTPEETLQEALARIEGAGWDRARRAG